MLKASREGDREKSHHKFMWKACKIHITRKAKNIAEGFSKWWRCFQGSLHPAAVHHDSTRGSDALAPCLPIDSPGMWRNPFLISAWKGFFLQTLLKWDVTLCDNKYRNNRKGRYISLEGKKHCREKQMRWRWMNRLEVKIWLLSCNYGCQTLNFFKLRLIAESS